MKKIITIIIWIAFIGYAIYFLDKQAHEHGIIAIIFGIPAAAIGGAVVYAITRSINDSE